MARPTEALDPATGARPILPIAARLDADERHAGRGVAIAFIDSGFFAHPDLITPRNRIAAYHDLVTPGFQPLRAVAIGGARAIDRALFAAAPSAWHGMMTSVVAAGNGALSGGAYRGLAHEAELVLVKAGSGGSIAHDDIRRGIEWVIEHRARYGVRVLNISCGGDYEASYHEDALSQAAEAATRAGICVVAAVGNAGHEPRPKVLPPASAPSVIAVGGFDDGGHGLAAGGYHSSYGPTLDGLAKPEIVAPAIWVAAPILPGTPTAEQARLLALLDASPDEELHDRLRAHAGIDADLDAVLDRDPYLVRQLVAVKQRDQQLISGHYKHVDGTSFAAPIVSSVIAQMLEANPRLAPHEVRAILTGTARRLPGIPAERQGFGVIRPRAAVEAAREAAQEAVMKAPRRAA